MNQDRERWRRDLELSDHVRAQPATLAAKIAEHATSVEAPWFWLEHADLNAHTTSWFGIASSTSYAGGRFAHEFLDTLRSSLGSYLEHPTGLVFAGTSGGFRSGWVLNLSYEFGVALLRCRAGQPFATGSGVAAHPTTHPTTNLNAHTNARTIAGAHTCQLDVADQSAAYRVTHVLELSHHTGALTLYGEPGAEGPGLDWEDMVRARPEPSGSTMHAARSRGREARWRTSESGYLKAVQDCQASIADGDAYVLCLTDSAESDGQRDPLATYARLRTPGPVVRGGVISEPGVSWVSASPERFLQVRAGVASTSPVKGTRARADDPVLHPDADARLRNELANDPKERAENLMIVDLMRNDFSRVCDPSSIETSAFLRVRSLPRVHQLESTVTGHLLAGHTALDLIEACVPGGSMTGAPKQRAVDLLAALERGPRGLYSGCSGWLDLSGDLDLGMNIRGATLLADRAIIGAGGGITIDSVASSEFAEQRLKASGVLGALQ